LKIGPVGNGARIDNGDIRTFFERDDSIPSLFEGVDQSLGLELVYLTAKCSNGNSSHSASLLPYAQFEAEWSSSVYRGKFQIPNSKFQINRKRRIQMTKTIPRIISI
jgi:hypothetical protein